MCIYVKQYLNNVNPLYMQHTLQDGVLFLFMEEKKENAKNEMFSFYSMHYAR